jgi:hypothetical protein
MRHPGFELVKEVPLRMQGNDMDISGEVVHDSAFTDSATPASNPNIFKIDVEHFVRMSGVLRHM